jgi:hypothetical protein
MHGHELQLRHEDPRDDATSIAVIRQALDLGATGSMEVDTAFFSDPGGAKSDLVDVNIGEFSAFDTELGYYPRASASTQVFFRAGWRDRLVTYET